MIKYIKNKMRGYTIVQKGWVVIGIFASLGFFVELIDFEIFHIPFIGSLLYDINITDRLFDLLKYEWGRLSLLAVGLNLLLKGKTENKIHITYIAYFILIIVAVLFSGILYG